MNNNKKVLCLDKIIKIYKTNNKKILILDGVSLEFEEGKFYLIIGHSGSGKTTLINILGLIDSFDSGEYKIYGKNVASLNDFELSKLRMKNIGYIFQNFYLDPNLKAYENIIVPMCINSEINFKYRKARALKLLDSLDIKERFNHFPNELSGGEQQRVAIARALANDPSIILADEPTGNLDEENEKIIFEKLKKLSKDGKCVIVVSHSNNAKKYADVIFELCNHTLKEVNCENK